MFQSVENRPVDGSRRFTQYMYTSTNFYTYIYIIYKGIYTLIRWCFRLWKIRRVDDSRKFPRADDSKNSDWRGCDKTKNVMEIWGVFPSQHKSKKKQNIPDFS